MKNKAPQAYDKAALSEALYHANKELSAHGPLAIVNVPSRTFETVRLFLPRNISKF
jgi:hypothetical protein